MDTATYLAPLAGERPFGVKINIEGAEPKVLPAVISMPGLRFCIFEGANNQRELFDLFTRAGFALFGLRRSILTVTLAPATTFIQASKHHDLLAIRGVVSPDVPVLSLSELCRLVTDQPQTGTLV